MISAIITAAGSGKRFGQQKMLIPLGGKPLLARTIERFLACKDIDEIIVTAQEGDIVAYEEIIDTFETDRPIRIVLGGGERIESLLNGVNDASGNIVITHDGARPFPSPALITSLIDAVKEHGAAMTAVNPTATIKLTHGSRMIKQTLPRMETWIAQTPQGFKREILKEALTKAVHEQYFIPTDDSEIVSGMTGHPVRVVQGEETNIKVTYPHDLHLAEHIQKGFSQ